MIPTAARAARRLWATYELIKSDIFEDEGLLVAARCRANLDKVLEAMRQPEAEAPAPKSKT